ncbi:MULTISPECIES: hypothetical protein [Bacillus]|uniref:Uncharacterized protein n=1 Tax=Bacillus velezensis TaxID=492670 RepID=A0ABC8D9S1_BACVE|nr:MULTISPECIES: hypothetical protein [Bacillus]ANB49366.1 hypothetical protein A1D33_018935 [Bacillus velezensis]AVI28907.1 hypothetical protein C3Z10_11190 [Bacillus velezensis]AWX72560.1 hypothetical protein BVDSYZ_11210 [Bacillus velezensis]MBR7816861.1 hypothetical protein [Bacillus sp. CCNWLCWHY013]MDK2560070.1 hypothetical protein [Bacillus amyloliquefaciens]
MDCTKLLEEKYPNSIIQYVRQREGLDKKDGSMDKEILEMTSSEVFRDVLAWNGLLGGWDHIIKDWIKSIYGINLDDFEK